MGYRSDVTIVIYGDKDDVTAFIAGERLKGLPKGSQYHPLEEPLGEYHTRDMYDYGTGQTMMKWSWFGIKWYDSYPEIAYWETLASVWEDGYKNTSLCMEMAKIGENADDLEVIYYGEGVDYCLSLHSEISEDNMPEKSTGILNLKESKNE